MAGAIIENLSGRKLGILIVFLMLCQVVCFLVGALIGEETKGTRNYCLHCLQTKASLGPSFTPCLSLLLEAVTPLFPSRRPLGVASRLLGYVLARQDRGMSEGGRENVAGRERRAGGGRHEGRRSDCTWCPVCQLGVLGSKHWWCVFRPPLPVSPLGPAAL